MSVVSWSVGGSTSSSASKGLCLRCPGSAHRSLDGVVWRGWRRARLDSSEPQGGGSFIIPMHSNCPQGSYCGVGLLRRAIPDSRMALVLRRTAGRRKGPLRDKLEVVVLGLHCLSELSGKYSYQGFPWASRGTEGPFGVRHIAPRGPSMSDFRLSGIPQNSRRWTH